MFTCGITLLCGECRSWAGVTCKKILLWWINEDRNEHLKDLIRLIEINARACVRACMHVCIIKDL